MANLVMDFLQGIRQAALLPVQASEDFSNTFANLGNRAAGGQDQTIQQNLGNTELNSKLISTSGATGTNRQLAGDVGQIGLDALAPGITGPAEAAASPLIDAAGQVAGKVGAGLAKGAVAGAAVGGAQGVAQGVSSNQKLNAKNLSMDFLGGAESGAAFGGVVGGAVPAIQGRTPLNNEIGAVGANVLDDDTAAKIAKSDDPGKIEKLLEPKVGPVVANHVAASAATTTDPAVVQNLVKNDIQNKLPDQPAPIAPQGPTTDVNTPAQVTAEEQSLFNSGPAQPDQQSLLNSGQQLSPGDVTQQPETEPTPTTARPFMRAPGETGPSELTKQSASQGMKDILNQGGTVDQALLHYVDKVGGGLETEFEAKKNISDFLNSPEVDRSKVNAMANPRYAEGAKFLQHDTAEGDAEGPVKDAQTVHNAIMRDGNRALAEVDKLSATDLKLMDDLRTTPPQQLAKQAENPEQFMTAAKATKAYNDLAQGIGSGYLGQDVAYRQQYGAPLLLDNTPEGREQTMAALAKLKMTPGYGKGRFFQDYDEAAQYGAQRQFANFRDDLAYDVQRRANDLSQLTMAKGFEQAFPGKVQIGQIGSGPEGTTRQLLIPGGQKISLPKEIADRINARAPAPDASGALKGYDTINAGLKNLKLGGGGFHAINVAGTYLGQQLLSGHAFTDPTAISDMVKTTFSDIAMKQLSDQMDSQGYLRAFDQIGLKYGPGETAGDVEATGKLANIPVLKQLHQAIFNRQIPYMKMRVMQQWMDDHNIDPTNLSKENIQAATKVAKQLNNNYGGVNRAIQGLTPRTFKLASRGLLATDYTEGQLRTLVDAFSKGGDEGTMARQVVAGKALLFAGLATVGGLAGGEFKGKNPQEIAADIIAKTINPQFKMGGYTVSLPETQLSEFAKPVAGSIANAASGKNPRTPLENFATARLAALPSEAFQLADNKDFYNNPIYGTDYYGRPISPESTALNVLSGVTPVPASQGLQAAQGNISPEAAVANTAGLKASPTYSAQYAPVAGQTYLSELQQAGAPKNQVQADTQFFDIVGSLSKARSKALTTAEAAVYKQDPAKAQAAVNAYSQKLIKQLQPWIQNGGTKYLDPTMLTYLRSNMLTLGTASKYARSDIKANPTKFGLPVTASTLLPPAEAAQLATASQSGNNSP